MIEYMTKTKIDKLGDRLRKGPVTDDDLRLLDEYRRSFGTAYETVVGRIRRTLSLEPTGRPAKSTTAIIDKLHRESIRLTQIQDIAGCRLVVSDVAVQEQIVELLKNLFPESTIVDRRTHPSYGYRAIHVIVAVEDKLVEIQIRTELQHQWAEISEKLSDMIDPAIKYGMGNTSALSILTDLRELVEAVETGESALAQLVGLPNPTEELKQQIVSRQVQLSQAKQQVARMLKDVIVRLERARENK